MRIPAYQWTLEAIPTMDKLGNIRTVGTITLERLTAEQKERAATPLPKDIGRSIDVYA